MFNRPSKRIASSSARSPTTRRAMNNQAIDLRVCAAGRWICATAASSFQTWDYFGNANENNMLSAHQVSLSLRVRLLSKSECAPGNMKGAHETANTQKYWASTSWVRIRKTIEKTHALRSPVSKLFVPPHALLIEMKMCAQEHGGLTLWIPSWPQLRLSERWCRNEFDKIRVLFFLSFCTKEVARNKQSSKNRIDFRRDKIR